MDSELIQRVTRAIIETQKGRKVSDDEWPAMIDAALGKSSKRAP